MKTPRLRPRRAQGLSLEGLPITKWLLEGSIPLWSRPVDQTWVYQGNLTDESWAHNPHRAEVQVPLHSSLHQWLTSDVEIAPLNYRGRLYRELMDASESLLLPLSLRFLVNHARGVELWKSHAGQTLLYAYAWAAAKHASQIWSRVRTVRNQSVLQPEREDMRFLSVHAIAELEHLGHRVDSPEFLFAALRPLWGTGMDMEQCALLRVPTLYRWLGKHLETMEQVKQSTMTFTKSEMAPASVADQVMLKDLCSVLHRVMGQTGLHTFSPAGSPTPCSKSGAESEATESRAEPEAESREAESREAESREAESREAESRQAESREAESREAEPREAEPREAESQEAESREVEFDARFMDWTFASHYSTWTRVEPGQALATRIYGLEFSAMDPTTRIELEDLAEEDAFEEAHTLLDELPANQASDLSESRRSLILC